MDDVELAEGLKAGSTEAQLELWRKYWDAVYPICARILKNPADGTDVAVDLLTDFMNHHVKQLNKPEALSAYLRLMAIRRAMSYRERYAKMAPLNYDPKDHNGTDPEEIAHWRALAPRLRACLNELTPKARQALRLRYGQQQNNVEIGRRLVGSKQYIGRLIKQSLASLKRCIEFAGATVDPETR